MFIKNFSRKNKNIFQKVLLFFILLRLLDRGTVKDINFHYGKGVSIWTKRLTEAY